MRQNKLAEARDWLAKSLALAPDRKYAHYYLGQVQVKLGNVPEAIRHHREAKVISNE